MEKVHLRLGIALTLSLMPVDLCLAETDISAFGTLAADVSDQDTSYDGVGETIDFEQHSIFGMQIDYSEPDSNYTYSGQIIGRGKDAWTPVIEWAYVSFNFNEHHSLRFGKLRLPIYSLSDTLDVGVTYPWARPVKEIYGRSVAPTTSYGGLGYSYYQPTGQWDLTLDLYGGSGQNAEFEFGQLKVPIVVNYFAGISALISKPNLYIRLTYTFAKDADLKLQDAFVDTVDPNTTKVNGFSLTQIANANGQTLTEFYTSLGIVNYKSSAAQGEFFGIASEYSLDDYHIRMEVGKRTASNLPAVPETESGYLTFGKNINNAYAYTSYAKLRTDGELIIQDVESYSLGLNYNVNANMILKVELSKSKLAEGSIGFYDVLPAQLGGPDDLEDPTMLSFALSVMH